MNHIGEENTNIKPENPQVQEEKPEEKVEKIAEETETKGEEKRSEKSEKSGAVVMGMDQLIREVENKMIRERELPVFSSGDTIRVYYKTNDKVQAFEGVVLQIRGTGRKKTVTVRKISSGIGVEKIFPLYSPNLQKIEVKRRGKVRRARIFYMRERRGKRARIKELREK